MSTVSKNSGTSGSLIIGVLLAFSIVLAYYQFGYVPSRFTPLETGPITESEEKPEVLMLEGSYIPNANVSFFPRDIATVVGANNTVIWNNTDSVAHTVTAEAGQPDPRFDKSAATSNFVQPGEEFKFTFTRPGTYHYFCVPHPWMRGTVIVTAPAV
jgi:plastocyanin